MMRISAMTERLTAEGLVLGFAPGKTDLFDRVEFDSREVESDNCFVAIRGNMINGHLFIDKAVKNGAVAIVYEAAPEISMEGLSGVALLHVSDSRKALLQLASMQFDDPADDLTLIGTTGTNGKTTVATLIKQVMDWNKKPCGFIGTTEYSYGDTRYPAKETTPSAIRVYSLLNEMKNGGCRACSMEVSSHALDQWRVNTSDFDAAVFTNLTRDHLDYHVTEEAYLDAKKSLFDGLTADSTAVVNADDEASAYILKDISANTITFGQHDTADVFFKIVSDDVNGLRLDIGGKILESRLSGHFNASNLAAAYACGIGLNLSAESVRDALENASPVAGRFELIHGMDDKSIVVDYAHTPDALRNVLKAARAITKDGSKLWCVFGCGGDRDVGKRSIMGAIAEELADRVIVTSDNPRTEDPEFILKQISEGLEDPQNAHFIVDRKQAIEFAAAGSSAADLIVIAGKGHETVQVVGTTPLPFDDRAEVRRTFGADMVSN